MAFWRKRKMFSTKDRLDIKSEPVIRRMPFASSVVASRKMGKWNRRIRKWLKWALILGAFALVVGFFGTIIAFALVSRDLPDPNKLIDRKVVASTKIWDRTGTHLLYEIHGDQNRTVVQLSDIAPIMVKATIASEDRNFYTNQGFQIKSFVRAIFQAVFFGRRLEGTSTITQQVVKNVILSNERTLSRKVKEVILAYQIEKKFSKDQILQIYFNETPYGSDSYGVESAAQMYFGKSAKDLDPAEAALLTALVPAPSRLSPYGSNKAELISRQQYILGVMHDLKDFSDADYAAAKAEDVMSQIRPHRQNIFAPHFSLYVKELLADQYGEAEVEEGGLNVITTLDYDKQQMAEKAVDDGMAIVQKYGGSNAGLVSVDPKTGQVLAMVGSHDYYDAAHDGNVNVIFSELQPGSSIKPIVYATALEKGYTPDTVVFDVKTSFPTDSGVPYTPSDYDGGERGPVPLRKAIAGSLNIPAVKVLYLAGIQNTLDTAKKFGYTTIRDASNYGLSLVLGGIEVKPIEHAAAYGVFATEGTYRPPAYILKVTDSKGQTLQEWQDAPQPNVIGTETARNISMMLSDNTQRAYIFGARNHLTLPDRPVAAKSGTTNDFNDAWTMGYTPSLVTGVWVGNNDHSKMKSKADGSTVAAPIWQQYMTQALAGTPVESFNAPQPIVTGKPVLDGRAGEVTLNIDKFTGKIATDQTPPGAIEQRTYRQVHDILYYVNKDDPRGAPPADPTQDPQFQAWENGVADWAARNNWTPTEPPPTETDDSQVGTDHPSVSLLDPPANADVAQRTITVSANVTSGTRPISRVEFSLEGIVLATVTSAPWQATIDVPPTLGKGFYTLRATAYDDIQASGYDERTINYELDGQPLVFTWARPSVNATITDSHNFPYAIDASLSDMIGVTKVEIVASATDGTPISLGSLQNPKTPGVSVTWQDPAPPGRYVLSAIVQLWNNTSQTFVGPTITVKP